MGSWFDMSAASPALTLDEKSTLTAEVLRNLLSYDAETGIFTWRGKPNGRVAHGAQAGTLLPNGYVRVKLHRKLYLAHRLAWFYVHGVWPENEIDHINRTRSDNRIANLREATKSENLQNQISAQRHNTTSKLLGASWHEGRQKWQAQIYINGKAKYLGLFKTKEEAHAAYLAAKRELHPFSTIED